MIRPSLLALSACLALASPVMAEKLTPERLFSDPDINGPTAKGVALSPDGKRVTYLKAKPEAANVQDLWAVDVKGGEPYRLIDANALSSGDKALSEAEIARRERARVLARGVVEYSWDSEGRFVLVPLDGDLYVDSVADGKVTRLTQTPGDEVDAKVSPKGRFVSYVRDQNLYVRPLTGGEETAVTAEGKGALSFGVAEFIAQEEMDRDTGYWWSPDERLIAYTRVDESGVDIVPRADIGPSGATVIDQRYPRAGRPNAIVDLFVKDLASGKVVQIDLGADKDIYLARVAWSKDGKTLYVQRQSRDQKTLDLIAFNPAGGQGQIGGKTILTETDPHWVELHDDFRPLKDGSFLWSSEKSGNKHLYRYAADGKLLAQVTKGDWPVDKIEAVDDVDEKRGLVFFSASIDTPIERRLYSVSYTKPAAPKAMTPAGGWWTTKVAATGAFVGSYSDPKTPPQTALYDPAGKRVRWIEENRLDAAHPYAPYAADHLVPEFGTLKAADGQALHYSLLKPANFDASKKYPVIVSVYGGPHAQRVTKAWNVSDEAFANAGYVVFKLDNRGSSNRSTAFKTALDRRMGTVEVEDQFVGAAFLKTLPYVDAERLGVMGWSYGGFMTLMMLSAEGTPFKAGVAGAPPTEWGLYDTHYTEQFMGKPDENKAGYAASDFLGRVDKLKPGSLMLIHGMADDNVIFENSTRVLAALQKKGIAFETMLYPGERHSVIRSRSKGLHVMKTHLDFFDRKLKGE
ncbi:S9 family peptidase [Caulobacter sp. CCNWLY153]|uniref:S9 family peptidase n=1 Tax=unclassified Caulobacter TaxID=2648921 RepID=UPI002FF0C365